MSLGNPTRRPATLAQCERGMDSPKGIGNSRGSSLEHDCAFGHRERLLHINYNEIIPRDECACF